jgi:hypothetical protein
MKQAKLARSPINTTFKGAKAVTKTLHAGDMRLLPHAGGFVSFVLSASVDVVYGIAASYLGRNFYAQLDHRCVGGVRAYFSLLLGYT